MILIGESLIERTVTILYNINPKLEIVITNKFGYTCTYCVNWLAHVRDNYYEAGLIEKGGNGGKIYLIEIKDKVMFPIACTHEIANSVSAKIDLMRKLNMVSEDINNAIVSNIIKEHECQNTPQ